MLLRTHSDPLTLPEWTKQTGGDQPVFTSSWHLSKDGSTFTRMDDVGQIYVFHIVADQVSVI